MVAYLLGALGTVKDPRRLEEIQLAELRRLFGRIVRVRLRVAPLLALALLGVAALDPAPWRLVVAGTVALLIVAVSVSEALRVDQGGLAPRRMQANLVAMAVFQVGMIFVTGGIESPFLPIIIPIAVLSGVGIGRRPALVLLVGLLVVAVAAMATGAVLGLLPDVNLTWFGGGMRAGHNDAHVLTSAVVMGVVLAFATFAGTHVRVAFDAMLERALGARADELAASTAHAAELGALSGEIAHELKNPLATIKGLATLLAQDAEGRSAERLVVLRAEVDRMQATLEEFLNFSRPLVPLALADTDVVALCAEVVAQHEGFAAPRDVSVVVDAVAPVVVSCDGRKVRQVLINLVQNAVDASPVGAAVTVSVCAAAGGVVVEVLDRGPGVPDDRRDRVFEAGVTTKASGSGLGLPIARGLVVQHGGDLRLVPRDGGGTRAVVSLPRHPPATEVAA